MSQSWNSRSRSDRFKTIVKESKRCESPKVRQGDLQEVPDRWTGLRNIRGYKPEIDAGLGVVREEVTVLSQGHGRPGRRAASPRTPPPRPQSRTGAPGGGSEGRTRVRGVLPGAPGHPQPGLTCAAERPGGIREASEAANCPGGHHLEQKRTKWKGLQVQMARQKTFLPAAQFRAGARRIA